MAKLIALLCFTAVLSSAFALECYKCERDGCDKPMDKWEKQTCGTVGDPACLKQVFEDKLTKKETTIRRCVIAAKVGNELTHNCDAGVGATKFCEICTGTLCNSATTVYGQYALVAAVLSYLLPKYLL
ncbi:uncharacterized protein LOC109594671 [Aethina tumida]|uniref:uncharacterized protein LOC109594671 n=1 Tax=Aethina tumida TaxID=116153 RepID=UPI00096B679B|nr:uncharacterized protein LOC109594671 [Aethina tumida]